MLPMTKKVKTVIEFYFLFPDFKSRGHPSHPARTGFSVCFGLKKLSHFGKKARDQYFEEKNEWFKLRSISKSNAHA